MNTDIELKVDLYAKLELVAECLCNESNYCHSDFRNIIIRFADNILDNRLDFGHNAEYIKENGMMLASNDKEYNAILPFICFMNAHPHDIKIDIPFEDTMVISIIQRCIIMYQ